MTEPVIEMSTGVRFAPFNGAYPEHLSHMEEAGLDPAINLWFAVFDFNDEEKTQKNWRLLDRHEEVSKPRAALINEESSFSLSAIHGLSGRGVGTPARVCH